MVISDGQTRVLDAIKEKSEKAQKLYNNLITNVNRDFSYRLKEFDKDIIKPKF